MLLTETFVVQTMRLVVCDLAELAHKVILCCGCRDPDLQPLIDLRLQDDVISYAIMRV